MFFLDIVKFLWKMGYLQFCWWFSFLCVHSMTNIWWWTPFLSRSQCDSDSTAWPTTLFIHVFESSPSLDSDCNGVFGSSFSIRVLYFYSTIASWFASYFEIGNSYLSSSRSFSFSRHSLREASTNEYSSALFVPNRYFTWHNSWIL